VNFPHVAQVWTLRRHSTNVRSGKIRTEIVHGITSLTPERADPERLLSLARGHWEIENKGHWIRDTTFGEDLSTVRKGNAPQVLATLRNLAVILLRGRGVQNMARARREAASSPWRALAIAGR